MIVEYGQLSESFKTESVIIRKENIYRAPQSGKISFFSETGQRIAGNQVVAKINSKDRNIPIYSREAGILSYSYDKLENELTPDNMDEITIKKFNNIDNNYKKKESGDYINKDEPFFRIVNNSDLYSLIQVDKNKAEKYWIEETVFIKDEELENSDLYQAKIKNIINQGEKSLLILELKRFIDKWLNKRKTNIELIKNIYDGLVVPDTAILPTSDGYKVVLVDSNNNYNLKNIEIKFNGGKYLVIKGLELGDEILINPTNSNYDFATEGE